MMTAIRLSPAMIPEETGMTYSWVYLLANL
jgi:hypothetical protein